MNTTIILCILATIYGLSIADSNGGNVNQNQRKFSIAQAILDMKSKVNDLTISNIEQLMKINMFLTLVRINFNAVFLEKMTTELNNTRVAVDVAITRGMDAEYCFTDSVNKFEKIRNDVQHQFSTCERANLDHFLNDISIFKNIITEGNAIIMRMITTLTMCSNSMFGTSRCIADRTEQCKSYIEQFNKKYSWYQLFRTAILNNSIDNAVLCLRRKLNESMKKIREMEINDRTCVEGAE